MKKDMSPTYTKNNKQMQGSEFNKNNKDYDILFVYRPNNILNKLFGLQKITYDGKNVKTVGVIAKLYAATLCILIIVFNVFLLRDLQGRTTVTIIVVIDVLSNVCVALTSIISILLAAFLTSPFILRALQGFKSIDEKLGIQGKKSYAYIRTRIIIAQLCLITISSLHLAYELLINVKLWSSEFRAITMHALDFLVYIQLLDFTTVIWIIITRLKIFNSQLEEMVNEESKKDKNKIINSISATQQMDYRKVVDAYQRSTFKLNTNSDEKKSENLLRLMKVFDEIADVANIVSSCYGLSLLFASTMTFLYIISTVNGLIMFPSLKQEDPNHTIPYVIGWCAPDVLYLLIAAYMSEKMKNEVEQTNSYIDKLSINTEHGSKLSELVDNFSQLLSVREVFVTAANFFPYDMTFILSLVGAVATYTVLLMQVKQPDKSLTVATNATVILNNTISNVTLN